MYISFVFIGYKLYSTENSPWAERYRKRKSFADSELDLSSVILSTSPYPSPSNSTNSTRTSSTVNNHQNIKLKAVEDSQNYTNYHNVMPYLVREYSPINNSLENNIISSPLNLSNYFHSKLSSQLESLALHQLPCSVSSFAHALPNYGLNIYSVAARFNKNNPKTRLVEESQIKISNISFDATEYSCAKPNISFSIDSIIGNH